MTGESETDFTRSLPAMSTAERRDALRELVIREFKATLLMDVHDDLPVDANYFDLGVSSLRAVEIKQRLEDELGRGIETSSLFNKVTIEQLVDHLASEQFADLFGQPTMPRSPGSHTEHHRPYVAQMLADLYRS
jgi:acyl carrier protein